MLLHVPLIIHGPVALLASLSFLVTFACAIERIFKDLISNDAVLDSDCPGSFPENSDEEL
jgi:hypothetical protein